MENGKVRLVALDLWIKTSFGLFGQTLLRTYLALTIYKVPPIFEDILVFCIIQYGALKTYGGLWITSPIKKKSMLKTFIKNFTFSVLFGNFKNFQFPIKHTIIAKAGFWILVLWKFSFLYEIFHFAFASLKFSYPILAEQELRPWLSILLQIFKNPTSVVD